jgi:peptide-methionine (S)-S-oxide reductase
MSIAKIGLGGGCHWCTEGVFSVIKGVEKIDQGWISSAPPYDEFSEAIIVEYDSNRIRLEELIQIHLHTHACTSNHTMRGKYRSAIYTFNAEDLVNSAKALTKFSGDFEGRIITQVLPYSGFNPSPETYQDYYQKNPDKPFCQTYIDPKVQLLIRELKTLVK